MIKYPSLPWLVKSLKKLGFTFPQFRNISYCGYTTSPNLLLTTTFQKVNGWTQLIEPRNINYLNGTFTALSSGVYEWHLERIYTNADNSPAMPITLAIEVRKNGLAVFNREIIIGAATNPSEPNASAFTSPFIFAIESNDSFEFFVKATMGVVNPTSTRLMRMQMTANKIHEIII